MRFCCIFLLALLFTTTKAFAIESIVVKGLFKNTAIVNIDGKQRILKVGKTSPEGATLISANSKKAVIEIEGKQTSYKLGQQISTHFKAAPEKASISITPDNLGMYRVNGNINHFSVKFLVDTGATMIAMSEVHAKRIGIEYKLTGKVGLARTASGTAKSWYVVLKKVNVGSLVLHDVDAAIIQGTHPLSPLLGNSFLNRIEMVRKGRMMVLTTK